MEIAKVEIEAVAKASAEAPALNMVELSELQQAMIGGGTGDIHLD